MQSLAEFWKIWQNSANFALSCTTSNVSNFIKTFSANYFQGHYCWNVLYNTCLFWLSKLFFIIINRFNSRISILQRINIFFQYLLASWRKLWNFCFIFYTSSLHKSNLNTAATIYPGALNFYAYLIFNNNIFVRFHWNNISLDYYNFINCYFN